MEFEFIFLDDTNRLPYLIAYLIKNLDPVIQQVTDRNRLSNTAPPLTVNHTLLTFVYISLGINMYTI